MKVCLLAVCAQSGPGVLAPVCPAILSGAQLAVERHLESVNILMDQHMPIKMEYRVGFLHLGSSYNQNRAKSHAFAACRWRYILCGLAFRTSQCSRDLCWVLAGDEKKIKRRLKDPD